MTTICASRQHSEMASDTRVSGGPTHFPSRKVFEVAGMLVGMAGRNVDCNAFLSWMQEGSAPDKRPTLADSEEFEAIVLSHEGLFYYEGDCVPLKIERDFHAIGTGAQAAIASLMCGKTPRRAVEIACAIDVFSGKPVEVYTL